MKNTIFDIKRVEKNRQKHTHTHKALTPVKTRHLPYSISI